MQIFLVGLSHKTAPLEVLERVTFPKEQLPEALLLLKEQIGEGVILSTCNRTEIYCGAENPPGSAEQIVGLISETHGLAPDYLSRHTYIHENIDAVRHLFRVASGLDSMILGESQVLGQVRDALTAASESHSVEASLVGLFHAAIRTGRRVREETDVGRNALSISYAGVRLAQRVVGTLGGSRVLLIGAGEAGRLVANALRTVGVSELMIANRTSSRGEELAKSLGGITIPFDGIEATLGDADIVIAATDSPGFIITRDMVASAAQSRRTAPLFVFDLAVPRDVDPEVADLEGVKLFNIDDLSSIAEENPEERKRAATAAEAIVEDELGRFMRWWDSLNAVPIVKTLWQQAEDLRKRELGRALRDMPDLSEEHREVVEALTQSIVKKLLHEPTVFLKQRANKSQLDAVRDLFRLWDES